MDPVPTDKQRPAKRRGSRFFLVLEILTLAVAFVVYLIVFRPREILSSENDTAFIKGEAALKQGHFDEARGIFLSTLDYAQKQGSGELAVAASQERIAVADIGLQKYGEAISLLETARPVFKKYQKQRKVYYAYFLSILGNAYYVVGRETDAETAANDALAAQEKDLGPNDPALIETLNALTYIDYEQGHYEKAASIAERALAISRANFGSKNSTTAWALSMLSLAYDGKGEFPEAERLAREALPILKSKSGPESLDVAADLYRLGLALDGEGRLGEAEDTFRRALAIREDRLGTDSPELLGILRGLFRCSSEQGKKREAVEIRTRAEQIAARQSFSNSTDDPEKWGNPPIVELPTEGSINGNIYTNRFFQFSLRFPEDWKVLGHDQYADEDASTRRSPVLLTVGTVDGKTHVRRSIVIFAHKIPPDKIGLGAEDYLRSVVDVPANTSMPFTKEEKFWSPTGDPREVSLGGKRMARLNMTGQIEKIPTRWSLLLTIQRGYGLMFICVDSIGGASGMEASGAIESLHFFLKTN